MKKHNELDVDFIGGQQPLTKEEALAISAFIKANKEKGRIKRIRKAKRTTSIKAIQHN